MRSEQMREKIVRYRGKVEVRKAGEGVVFREGWWGEEEGRGRAERRWGE